MGRCNVFFAIIDASSLLQEEGSVVCGRIGRGSFTHLSTAVRSPEMWILSRRSLSFISFLDRILFPSLQWGATSDVSSVKITRSHRCRRIRMVGLEARSSLPLKL